MKTVGLGTNVLFFESSKFWFSEYVFPYINIPILEKYMPYSSHVSKGILLRATKWSISAVLAEIAYFRAKFDSKDEVNYIFSGISSTESV
mgnify:CR=1 FL=1